MVDLEKETLRCWLWSSWWSCRVTSASMASSTDASCISAIFRSFLQVAGKTAELVFGGGSTGWSGLGGNNNSAATVKVKVRAGTPVATMMFFLLKNLYILHTGPSKNDPGRAKTVLQ